MPTPLASETHEGDFVVLHAPLACSQALITQHRVVDLTHQGNQQFRQEMLSTIDLVTAEQRIAPFVREYFLEKDEKLHGIEFSRRD
jgi:hypothetical protein